MTGRRRRLVLSAGVADSLGLAFGWTVFLLAVTERDGYGAATTQYAAGLVGVAVSGPVSAWLAGRLSPRDLLRVLAVAEGLCRVGVFALFWLHAPPAALATLVGLMNVLAWSAFAAMRTEMSRPAAGDAGGRAAGEGGEAGAGVAGRLLTLYAVAILSSEALATGLASVVLSAAPPAPVLGAVAAAYGLALVPQWVVGACAPRERPVASRRTPWRVVALPCGVGGVVFLLAAAPALAATVLAYDLYGRDGVLVSAVAFAAGALGASRVQGVVGRWQPAPVAAFALGALLVGGWALSGTGLLGLAVAQVCAGVAQCALEGDLDARTVSRSGPATATSALALASSSRALGGALAVYLLPAVTAHVPLRLLCTTTAGVLAVAALASSAVGSGRRRNSPAEAVDTGRGTAAPETRDAVGGDAVGREGSDTARATAVPGGAVSAGGVPGGAVPGGAASAGGASAGGDRVDRGSVASAPDGRDPADQDRADPCRTHPDPGDSHPADPDPVGRVPAPRRAPVEETGGPAGRRLRRWVGRRGS